MTQFQIDFNVLPDQAGWPAEEPRLMVFVGRAGDRDFYAMRNGDLAIICGVTDDLQRNEMTITKLGIIGARAMALDQYRYVMHGRQLTLSNGAIVAALKQFGMEDRLNISNLSKEFFGRPIEINYVDRRPEARPTQERVIPFYGGMSTEFMVAYRRAMARRTVFRKIAMTRPGTVLECGRKWVDISPIGEHMRQAFASSNLVERLGAKDDLSFWMLVDLKGETDVILALPTKTTKEQTRAMIGHGAIVEVPGTGMASDIKSLICQMLIARTPVLEMDDVEPIAQSIISRGRVEPDAVLASHTGARKSVTAVPAGKGSIGRMINERRNRGMGQKPE